MEEGIFIPLSDCHQLLLIGSSLIWLGAVTELLTDGLTEEEEGVGMLLAVPAVGRFNPSVTVRHFEVAKDPCEDHFVVSDFTGHRLRFHRHSYTHLLFHFRNLRSLRALSWSLLDVLIVGVGVVDVLLEVLESFARSHNATDLGLHFLALNNRIRKMDAEESTAFAASLTNSQEFIRAERHITYIQVQKTLVSSNESVDALGDLLAFEAGAGDIREVDIAESLVILKVMDQLSKLAG
uniref:Uncharacterized protein n=1 Tax=Strombidium inclinatum TaxID=197538 RepID=A0A7S3IPH8_9SPIT|mmetsp:Transcript_2926/g.4518  ORF Transcript_2926/g.4518 Transcript_2926/m.4518 type:complete len:237 (+) Transcript_2926:949-1659(+)|eukprot:CAMPEP_0170511104 /NCGR_PEP_ID=MMETSP0208-20121228/66120_1 /TAXON_ID=197538 /ORGANISM="Strombidium inclinatum, Strain S3" /LENGTH=236 /DNA_ID=CAMNT_0010794609 /DNA_START=1752 /DNA_END=2462 /DNA_ORIENTATION=-